MVCVALNQSAAAAEQSVGKWLAELRQTRQTFTWFLLGLRAAKALPGVAAASRTLAAKLGASGFWALSADQPESLRPAFEALATLALPSLPSPGQDQQPANGQTLQVGEEVHIFYGRHSALHQLLHYGFCDRDAYSLELADSALSLASLPFVLSNTPGGAPALLDLLAQHEQQLARLPRQFRALARAERALLARLRAVLQQYR